MFESIFLIFTFFICLGTRSLYGKNSRRRIKSEQTKKSLRVLWSAGHRRDASAESESKVFYVFEMWPVAGRG